DAEGTDKVLTFDLELDPGRTLEGKLVGPDGKPVTGATAFGLTYEPRSERSTSYSISRENTVLETEAFTALGLDPQQPRTLTFVHKERKLVGDAVVTGDDKGPLTVQLEPWGTLTGRLVDADGKPLAGVRVWWKAPGLPAPGLRPADQIVETDRDGRFRVEGLVP